MIGVAAVVAELGRVLLALPGIEEARQQLGPRPAVEVARRLGRETHRRRSESARASLRRAIGWADRRLLPRGGNCYRRVLLEIALDAGAADEPVMMGFRAAGGPGSGHAWLRSAPPQDQVYDAVISV